MAEAALPSLSAIRPVEEIRGDFPALGRLHHGSPVAYFDAPGGTQVPLAVADAMREQMLEHNANAHWAYETSRELDEVLSASRAALADFLGGRPDDVVFGANMTTLTFHVARALGRLWGRGDEIVVTELDHQANVSPWRDLEAERGVIVRAVPLDAESGDLDWSWLEGAFSTRTRLLAITAASNALGTLVDLERARSLARSAGALLFVDAVHFAPHERIDVARMGCDFLACSPYKFYGPHIGVLWGRSDLLSEVMPPKLAPAPDLPPERWETGTLNHEGIAGAGAAVDFLASLGPTGGRAERLDAAFGGLSRRGHALVRRLWKGLESVQGVRLFGPSPDRPRTPTVSFAIAGWSPRDAADRLSRDLGLFLSHGNFYASLVTARLGLEPAGLLRAGCACYTTAEEVDRLLEGVERLAAEGPR